jgi:CubicO group peptidase (beta-lactamase class C family)
MKNLNLLFLLFFSLLVSAQDEFIISQPETYGVSSDRLKVLDIGIKNMLEKTKTPGAVVAILKDGKMIYQNSYGKSDMIKGTKMKSDAIFRIYSMTKPITSTAIMMLCEKGELKLSDPIYLYLPEFKDVKVAIENEGKTEILDLVPAESPITIQDLLRHTSGLSYGFFGPQTAIRKSYAGFSSAGLTSEAFCKKIATFPLIGQPGKRWEYSFSTDVLGRIVEVISGQRLGDFMNENIFTPLGMKDTGFHLPANKMSRVAQGFDYATNSYPDYLLDASKAPSMDSGGGGLFSTLADYGKFAQMILNKGELNGIRLLGSKTVSYMSSNHVGEGVDKGDLYLPGDGYGFGLGFAVRLENGLSAEIGSKGEHAWSGWAGTGFWIDPVENLIGLFMIQDVPNSGYLRPRFKALVYQTLVD